MDPSCPPNAVAWREVPMLRRMLERRLRGYGAIGYARGETPLVFGEVNDEVVVEYDEPDPDQYESADWSRATP